MILGLEMTDDDQDAIDPLVFGLVTESVWHILNGHARRLGLELDPDQLVEELLEAAIQEPVEVTS